ncbi:hypothetical protein EYC84_000778 [Monilinia fructicola]|uniref:Uncharacterized protein n=1 Tax=Monilinia fructicola TaxID=38448 RepID=A0A5M9JHX7_MONFR|nr:hypothetical protein EYC84_000778 [Monilinia fructicola]
MEITNPNRVTPTPLDKIDRHPNLSYWGGVLVISIDYQTQILTPAQNAATMSTLSRILPDYSFWAQITAIEIHTPNMHPSVEPEAEYQSHIETMKLIISELNRFPDLLEVRMCIHMEHWHVLRLKLGAGLFGLNRASWSLFFKIEGSGIKQVDSRCLGMLRLEGDWRREFRGPMVDPEEQVELREEVQESVETEIEDGQQNEDGQQSEESEEARMREAVELLESIQPYSDDEPRSRRSRWIPTCGLFCFRRR